MKDFEEALNKGEHLLLGTLKKYAVLWELTKKEDITFLNSNNLRNEIAHANIYYDSERDKLLMRGRKELTFDQFFEELGRVHHFFMELIYQLNNNQEDLVKSTHKLARNLSKEFLKIARSGIKRKIWKSIEFDWEKEKNLFEQNQNGNKN